MEQPHLMPDQKQLQTLLDACRGGDRDAFHLLFEQYKDRVLSLIHISPANGTPITVQTDANGNYTVPNVPAEHPSTSAISW